jgi:hypothetical protein
MADSTSGSYVIFAFQQQDKVQAEIPKIKKKSEFLFISTFV